MAEAETKNVLKRHLKAIIISASIILFIVIMIIGFYYISKQVSLEKTNIVTNSFSISQGLSKLVEQGSKTGAGNTIAGYTGTIITMVLRYVFGVTLGAPIPTVTGEGLAVPDAVIIINLAVWFVFFFTLKELFGSFGMFKKGASWGIAFFLTVAMANLHLFSAIINGLMGVLAGIAGLAVIVILGGIIGVAVISHLGLTNFADWMMNRKAMLEASQIRAGGKEAAAALTGLMDVGKALKKAGENVS